MIEEQAHSPAPSAPHIHKPGHQPAAVSGLVEYARQYARERPEVIAISFLSLGFLLGWKMKMW
jgi:hypothetical protein